MLKITGNNGNDFVEYKKDLDSYSILAQNNGKCWNVFIGGYVFDSGLSQHAACAMAEVEAMKRWGKVTHTATFENNTLSKIKKER